jgi:hypothetical protein
MRLLCYVVACVLVHVCKSDPCECKHVKTQSGKCSIDVYGCECVKIVDLSCKDCTVGKETKFKAEATETNSGRTSGDQKWFHHSEDAGETAVMILFNQHLTHTVPEPHPLQTDLCNCEHQVRDCLCVHTLPHSPTIPSRQDQKVGKCTIRATVCAMFNSTADVKAAAPSYAAWATDLYNGNLTYVGHVTNFADPKAAGTAAFQNLLQLHPQEAACLAPPSPGPPPPAPSPGPHPLCTSQYALLKDSWRLTSQGAPSPFHGDVPTTGSYGCSPGAAVATGLGEGWYRFMAPGGDVLPVNSPGCLHCGTDRAGWLSAWDPAAGTAPISYNTPGSYPTAAQGVVSATVCFHACDAGHSGPCYQSRNIKMLYCPTATSYFLLWQLPPAPDCASAYCTAVRT